MIDFAKAAELDPTKPEPLINRGMVRLALGEAAKAISDLTAAVRVAPDCAKARYERGRAQFANHDLRAARADFDNAALLAPDWIPPRLASGAMACVLGDRACASGRFAEIREEIRSRCRTFIHVLAGQGRAHTN